LATASSTLDRIERTTRFVSFEVRALLRVPGGTDPDSARRLLEKAEQHCLLSNSLSAAVHLIPMIDVVNEPAGELVLA
jgi:uncharacterized OsmC-like protein